MLARTKEHGLRSSIENERETLIELVVHPSLIAIQQRNQFVRRFVCPPQFSDVLIMGSALCKCLVGPFHHSATTERVEGSSYGWIELI